MQPRRRPLSVAFLVAGAGLTVVAAGCDAVSPVAEPTTLTIVAANIEFTPKRIQLPAGVPIHVSFRNEDAGIPHDLNLSPMRSGVVAPVLLDGELVPGPDSLEFVLEPLAPGPYLFSCSVHPSMQIEADAV